MYTNIHILPYELGNPIDLALMDLYKLSVFLLYLKCLNVCLKYYVKPTGKTQDVNHYITHIICDMKLRSSVSFQAWNGKKHDTNLHLDLY